MRLDVHFDEVLGIELKLIDENLYSCRSCLVSKTKDQVTIVYAKIAEGSLATIFSDLPKQYPTVITLSGKGVLHKNIKLDAQLEEHRVFQQAFPAIEKKDFYVQQFNVDDNFSVAVIRKTLVDELLQKLEQAGLFPHILSLGALPAIHILPQLNSYDREVQFDHHLFELTDGHKFLAYQAKAEAKNEFPIKIGLEAIAETNIVAYASAFQLLLNQNLFVIQADVDQVTAGFLTFNANAKLKKLVLFFLFALFGLLLLSFLLLSNYTKENAVLTMKVGSQTANADQSDLLKKTSAENSALLKRLNWNGGYNYGFLTNEIGSSIPKQLQLKEILINEFKSETEKQERTPSLKIIGETDNLTAVNNWIFVLKEKPWVKSVRLLKYHEDVETANYQFNILITY